MMFALDQLGVPGRRSFQGVGLEQTAGAVVVHHHVHLRRLHQLGVEVHADNELFREFPDPCLHGFLGAR